MCFFWAYLMVDTHLFTMRKWCFSAVVVQVVSDTLTIWLIFSIDQRFIEKAAAPHHTRANHSPRQPQTENTEESGQTPERTSATRFEQRDSRDALFPSSRRHTSPLMTKLLRLRLSVFETKGLTAATPLSELQPDGSFIQVVWGNTKDERFVLDWGQSTIM
jgi:hypothetical protein